MTDIPNEMRGLDSVLPVLAKHVLSILLKESAAQTITLGTLTGDVATNEIDGVGPTAMLIVTSEEVYQRTILPALNNDPDLFRG